MLDRIRVAAVDDHPVMLRGLETLVADASDRLRFVGHDVTVRDLLISGAAPDVVLLDLQLGDGSRPRDNVQQLRAQGVEVLVYTDGRQRSWMADAVDAGARAVVLKDQPVEDLVAAIEAAHAGQIVLSAQTAQALRASAVPGPDLSPREAEVLAFVAQGLADKQIARVVGISEETVKSYIKRMRAKYALHGRAAPTRVALSQRAAEDGYAGSRHVDGLGVGV